MITCIKCKEDKTDDQFYKSSLRKDGLTGECKSCCKLRVTEYNKVNTDKIKEYNKVRDKSDARKSAKKIYESSVEGKFVRKSISKKYRDSKPKVYKAHNLVNSHLRDGKLLKPETCENCKGNYKLEGHHCDYNKPLEVIWLCVPCHKEWHLNNTPIF